MVQKADPRLYKLIENVVTSEGFELVHWEFSGGQKQLVLRVFIDKPEGITHQDCSYISHQIGTALDIEDIISYPYVLEVSSPGINRGLYKKNDYVRFVGHKIRLKTRTIIEGKRNFSGYLEGMEEDQVKLRIDKDKLVLIPFDSIISAHLEIELDELFRRARL
jgi:ribosome maturation factor RimP